MLCCWFTANFEDPVATVMVFRLLKLLWLLRLLLTLSVYMKGLSVAVGFDTNIFGILFKAAVSIAMLLLPEVEMDAAATVVVLPFTTTPCDDVLCRLG